MSGEDDSEQTGLAGTAVSAIIPNERRRTDDDVVDLDYDEDASLGAPPDDKKVDVNDGILCNDKQSNVGSSEHPEKEDGCLSEKEDGELEDGELSSSEDEVPAPPKKDTFGIKPTERAPISARISFPNGRNSVGKGRSPPRRAKPTKVSTTATESAWERGLREAREAMRRASKVREEPDFDRKRLVAAPAVRRSSRNNTDSDRSNSPAPRKHFSRSQSPKQRIPSLMDIRMSPPRRVVPKDLSPVYHRRVFNRRSISPWANLPPMIRRSPSYGSPNKQDLGPQVIYPHGRPCPKREPEPSRERDRDRRRGRSPRRDRNRSLSRKRDNKRSSPKRQRKDSKDRKKSAGASPISSDSDSAEGITKDGRMRASRNDLSAVNDPWARKTKRQAMVEKSRPGKRRRRNSSSSSASSSSRSTIPDRRRAKKSTVSGSNSDDKDRKSSPPRGDISHYRIPKRNSKASKEKNAVDDFLAKRKTDVPAAFKRRSRRSSSPDSNNGGENIIEAVSSSSSDDHRRTRSSSSSRSSSSERSASPDIPARYRLSPARSLSPVSESSSAHHSPRPVPPHDKPASPPTPPLPPPKKSKDSEEQRINRKQLLLDQLREVEDALERQRGGGIDAAL